MGKFVNPFTDLGFKILFGQPASKELLITLLNELLAGEHHIEDLTFRDKEDHAENLRDKGIIYDLYCQTSTGEYIIVEMQNRNHTCFMDRTLYYTARAISRLIEHPLTREVKVPEPDEGEEAPGRVEEPLSPYGSQYKLTAVYAIFLMNFREEALDPDFRTDAYVTSARTGKVLHPQFRQIYLQFPYFTQELDECESLYERLMYALKNMQNWNKMPDNLKEQVFQRLEQLASVANLSEENRIAYDRALDRYRVNSIVEADVREEGRQEGEAKERIKNARAMKAEGIPAAVIARITGLSLEEIEEL